MTLQEQKEAILKTNAFNLVSFDPEKRLERFAVRKLGNYRPFAVSGGPHGKTRQPLPQPFKPPCCL